MIEKIKDIKLGYIAYAVLLAVLGRCFLTFSSSATTITVIIGIFVAFWGGASLALTLLEPEKDRSFIIRVIFASLIIVCGITAAVLNDKIFTFILFLVCIVAVTDGAFKLSLSMSCKYPSVS